MAEQPPYAPNVVNQTVSYGGATWKGNPGTGWTQEGGGSSSGSAPDYASMMNMYKEANAPVVASLQASIPEQQAKYAQQGQYLQKQVGNLDERYKTLLTSITGARDTAVQNVTTNTSQELGRRGISAESGLFGQTVNKATQPVQQAFAGDVSNLGNSQQSALDSLMNLIQGNTQSGIESTRAVQNAIAQLQAGGNQSGITSALDIWKQNQAATDAQKNRDLQEKLAAVKTTVNPLEQEKLLAEIANLQARTANVGSGGGGGFDLQSEFQKWMNGG
jgi:hypothetical protein